ncbi:hypothetical protein ACMFMG_007529 [Clarireedia jacksonii]
MNETTNKRQHEEEREEDTDGGDDLSVDEAALGPGGGVFVRVQELACETSDDGAEGGDVAENHGGSWTLLAYGTETTRHFWIHLFSETPENYILVGHLGKMIFWGMGELSCKFPNSVKNSQTK